MTWEQMKRYRSAVTLGAEALGIAAGGKEAIEEYRKAVLLEETGKTSSKDVDRTSEYEALMVRHLTDAGQWEAASMWTLGDDKRLAAMCDDCARQVGELSGKPELDRLAYLRGIMEQAGLSRRTAERGPWWMDYSSATPKMVFIILDKHRRRLVRKLCQGKVPVRYRFGTVWTRG